MKAHDTGKIYKLRPHHGMCLAFFIGKGYSDAFTENMGNMLKILAGGAAVRLHAGTDTFCEKCPNRKGAVCEKEETVFRFDKEVLSACGLKEGDVLLFDDFTGKVQTYIIGAGIRKEICGDCRWDYICGSVKSRWEK